MSLRELPDLIQGTDEWHEQRRGIVTASVVGQLVRARTLTGSDYACPACEASADEPCRSKAVRAGVRAPIKTLHQERTAVAAASRTRVIEPANDPDSRALTILLAAERITGWTDPTYMSDDMYRGVDDEPRAVDAYSEHTGRDVAFSGFMVRDDWGFRIGYSPDGVVEDDGLLEVKSRRPKKHLQTILADAVPAENMAQCQAGLLVSGRSWLDFISYCGGMPLWVKRVEPDPRWFAAIVEAVARFEDAVARITTDYTNAVEGLPITERVIEQEIVI